MLITRGLRERLAGLLHLHTSPGVEKEVEAVSRQIARLRGDVEEEREQPEVESITGRTAQVVGAN